MGFKDHVTVLPEQVGLSGGMAAAIAFRMKWVGLGKGLDFEGLEFWFRQLVQVVANGLMFGFCLSLFLSLSLAEDSLPLLA